MELDEIRLAAPRRSVCDPRRDQRERWQRYLTRRANSPAPQANSAQ